MSSDLRNQNEKFWKLQNETVKREEDSDSVWRFSEMDYLCTPSVLTAFKSYDGLLVIPKSI